MLLLYTLERLVLGPCRHVLRVVAMIRTAYFYFFYWHFSSSGVLSLVFMDILSDINAHVRIYLSWEVVELAQAQAAEEIGLLTVDRRQTMPVCNSRGRSVSMTTKKERTGPVLRRQQRDLCSVLETNAFASACART